MLLDNEYHPIFPEAKIKQINRGIVIDFQNFSRARRSKMRKKLVLWKRDPHCKYCGVPLEYFEATLDHVVARSKGGNNSIENLVLACNRCNGSKGDRSPDEFCGRKDSHAEENRCEQKMEVF